MGDDAQTVNAYMPTGRILVPAAILQRPTDAADDAQTMAGR
jgi:predicted metalloendopeptidase